MVSSVFLAAVCGVLSVLIAGALNPGNQNTSSKIDWNPTTAVPEKREINFLGEKRAITWGKTYRYNKQIYKVFTDEKGNFYFFDEKSNFSGYTNKADLVDFWNKPGLDKGTNKKTVEQFLNEHVKLSDFTFAYDSYFENDKFRRYTYNKYLNGFETAEKIEVDIYDFGVISSFRHEKIGVFDTIKLPNIDMNALKAKLNTEIKGKYKGNISYEINQQSGTYIDIDDNGKPVMAFDVTVKANEETMSDIFNIALQ